MNADHLILQEDYCHFRGLYIIARQALTFMYEKSSPCLPMMTRSSPGDRICPLNNASLGSAGGYFQDSAR